MILLTFNIISIEAETKKGFEISDEERLKITESNTRAILRILDLHDLKASFFIEISIAEKLQQLLKAISVQGHEIAFYYQDGSLEYLEEVKKKHSGFS